ncbi:MAG: FadR family transcriptional regulator [Anaerolineae bacterium]|nr:FadR family transcriptional regulator [Anaerolineae bacterium]
MGISFEPVERTTVSERIARRIINMINTGALKPGDKLPSERELMDQLHVSRSPIREALRSLSLLGVLETRAGDGTYVNEHITNTLADALEWYVLLGKRDILEWIEVREPLEIQAAGLAAQRVSPKTIKYLEKALVAYYDETEDFETMVETEINFHKAVVEISGNQTLKQVMAVFYDLYHDFVIHQRVAYARRDPREQGHQAIVDAIKTGDENAARKAMAEHLRISKQRALAEKFVTQNESS